MSGFPWDNGAPAFELSFCLTVGLLKNITCFVNEEISAYHTATGGKATW
jgi:hypothetical protein